MALHDAAVEAAATEDYWTCPMDPYVKELQPGKCPSCGMKLIPKSKLGKKKKTSARGTVEISTERQQLIGVKLSKVEKKELHRDVIAAGTLAADESRIIDVLSEIQGTVETVLGNPVGQQVRKGEPLLILATPDGKKATIRATATGHISWRVTYPGAVVQPKMKVCTIYDHGAVWVWIEIYETDIAFVKLGQEVTMTVPAHPGKSYTGKVSQISPLLQPDTHTLKVRVDFTNADFSLKPGMSAVIEIHTDTEEKLAIPESSIIRTGTANIVFVAKGEGRFEVRHITLGALFGEYYEVLEGLEEGEDLVSSASFLVDAESKLQGIESSWTEAP